MMFDACPGNDKKDPRCLINRRRFFVGLHFSLPHISPFIFRIYRHSSVNISSLKGSSGSIRSEEKHHTETVHFYRIEDVG